MERTDVARLLGVLKAAWPDRAFDGDTITAYELAWSDLPADLAQQAVAEHLRTGKFFPAPSEIRELALRAGVGLPAAEIAWQEAQRVVGGYRPGDAPPQWSSRVLQDTVAAVGWSALKACEADQLGTLRAQFRDTYNALLKQVTADDARAALAEAEGRRALLAFVPRTEPAALQSGPVPVPAGTPPAPAPEPGEPWALRKFRKRFEGKQPMPAEPQPSALDYLRTLPAWNALPQERRERLLAEHEARKAAKA